mmetsp:Transcript_55783/g.92469  ORF Transcript_55783/g.92469 Transcript_55783/m.92469 type:complete len:195 (+) Transcript_55783:2-586(+)
MPCPCGGEICNATCWNGCCSGPMYRIVPLVVCIISLIFGAIAFFLDDGDDDNGQESLWLIGGLIADFFILDYIIQCCVIKGSQVTCCGECQPGCSTFLVIKLIHDGIFVFLLIVQFILEFTVESAGMGNLRVLRILRLADFMVISKLGMEIGVISSFYCCKPPPSGPVVTAANFGAGAPIAVVGQPVQVGGKQT